MGLPTDSVLLRNPPETEYWTRFLTKRRDPGFSHPNDYLSLDAESSAENEYWTRFMTKRGYRARSRLQFHFFVCFVSMDAFPNRESGYLIRDFA